jgi:hypothetical protein
MNRTIQLIIAVLAIFSASFIADDVIGVHIYAALLEHFRDRLFVAGELNDGLLASMHHGYEMIVWTIQALFVVGGLLFARRHNLFGAGQRPAEEVHSAA